MTPDPITAALDQLAAHHEQIARLDRTVQDLQGTLAKLVDVPLAARDAAGQHLRRDAARPTATRMSCS